MRRILLALLPITCLAACSKEEPVPEPVAPVVPVVEEPPWKAMVLLNPPQPPDPELGEEPPGTVMVAVAGAVADHDIQVLRSDGRGAQGPGSLPDLDVPALTGAREGWLFVEKDRCPFYQPAGPADEVLAAAGRYFGLSLGPASGWRLILALKPEEGDTTVKMPVPFVERTVAQHGIHVVWREAGATGPLNWTATDGTAVTVDPADWTDRPVGWLFARDGADPQYLPPVAGPAVLEAASAYFGVELRPLERKPGERGGKEGRKKRRLQKGAAPTLRPGAPKVPVEQ